MGPIEMEVMKEIAESAEASFWQKMHDSQYDNYTGERLDD